VPNYFIINDPDGPFMPRVCGCGRRMHPILLLAVAVVVAVVVVPLTPPPPPTLTTIKSLWWQLFVDQPITELDRNDWI